VAEKTRRRVLQAVEDLGYRPSVIARGLKAGESRIIGYSWRPGPPNQFNPIVERFILSVAEAAARHGYHALTFPYPEPSAELEVYRGIAYSGRVDGFVLPNTRYDDPRMHLLLEAGFPFVAFGRSNPDWDFPWVDVDGYDGVAQAMAHLLELGHRRIACLGWCETEPVGEDRLAAYRHAMASAGLSVEPEWIARIENDHDQAYQAARAWVQAPPDQRPTAVVALSDLMAIGVMNAAADAGLSVGHDLAIAGFDDAPVAALLRPALTSVRQPIWEVAEHVLAILVELLHGETRSPHQVLLKPQLIVRDSTALSATSVAPVPQHTVLKDA